MSQIAGLEKERDFYYQKLRDVETICQEPECETQPYIQKILEVLYATEVCWSLNRSRSNFFFKEGFEIPDESEQFHNIEQEEF